MAEKKANYKKLKDYTGASFNVEEDFGSLYLTSALYTDKGYVDKVIKSRGKVPEKLICFIGSDGFYRIFEAEKVNIDNFHPEMGKRKVAHETNSAFLTAEDLKNGKVSIVEPTEDGKFFTVIGTYYLNMKTGAESEVPFESSEYQKQ